MSKVLILIAMDKEGSDFATKNGFCLSTLNLLIPEIPAIVYEKKISATDSQFLVVSGSAPYMASIELAPLLIWLL